jgi:hypothetical protein
MEFKYEIGTESVPSVAFPGLYPLFYTTKDCETLCPKCVNDNLSLCVDGRNSPDDFVDDSWKVTHYDINWECTDMQCANCYCQIESAYGEKE